MSILSWNCRGLTSSESPTVPYLFWLLSKFKPSFLFLQETKSSVSDVYRLFCSTSPTVYYGVDARETRGGGGCSFLFESKSGRYRRQLE